MTEGRRAGSEGGVGLSGELGPPAALPPLEWRPSDLPARREMVNWVGSFPSLRSRSGSRRLRALMNQLQI